ncbi:MAG TPA: alanine racemase [bacterium]|nr:alanine racemase [bacterium]
MFCEDYCVARPEDIETPALLVFEDRLDGNIKALIEQVGGGERLAPHVKTHKSAEILRRQMAAGIRSFKCATLSEAEMIARGGADDLLLAYPIAQPLKARRFMELKARYPKTLFRAMVSSPAHAEILSAAAVESGDNVDVMIDLDVGMHRTGIEPGEAAFELCLLIHKTPGLRYAGIHAYDGQNNQTDIAERESAAGEALDFVKSLRDRLKSVGLETSTIMMGGSICYPFYTREDGIQGSPGTVAYWDGNYMKQMPDMPFRCAALVLTQVVDSNPARDLVTLDLGSKAICCDQVLANRALFPGYPQVSIVKQNEEHCVLKCNGADLKIGDYLLAIPGHVCTAVVRYPGALLINRVGEVSGYIEHTSRDRLT